MTDNDQKLDWSGIALLEYLISKKNFKDKFIALDIGSALGSHTSIMRSYGLSVDIIDKYENDTSLTFTGNGVKTEFDIELSESGSVSYTHLTLPTNREV